MAVLLAVLIVALQGAGGAWQAEFGQDEASHYVSGLLLHDWLAAGLPPLLAYVRVWHGHYPLVGIGHWPPLFYLVEAGWMGLLGTGRVALLLLSATVALATALLLYAQLARRHGAALAAAAAGIFVTAPLIQAGSAALMLDVPVALACLLAMLAYRRVLDRGGVGAALLFALAAAAAMLVKGNAACLALLPPAALLLGRRGELLRQPAFWLPLPVVAALVGPWYWLTYGRAAAGFRFAWGLDYALAATRANAADLAGSLGLPILLLAAAGFGAVLVRPRQAGSLAVAAAALFTAVWLFQSAVPAALQARYLAPAVPPLLILAVTGLTMLARLPALPVPPPALAGALALAFLLTAAGLVRKPQIGVAEAVAQLLAAPVAGNPAILLAADPDGETAAIAEIAMHDTARPHCFAVRGSRLLGGGGYNNADYAPRFATLAAVMAAIDAARLPTVLLRRDGRAPEWTHLAQVAAAAAAWPQRWRPLGRVALPGAPPILLFRLAGNDIPADPARLLALSAPRGLPGP